MLREKFTIVVHLRFHRERYHIIVADFIKGVSFIVSCIKSITNHSHF